MHSHTFSKISATIKYPLQTMPSQLFYKGTGPCTPTATIGNHYFLLTDVLWHANLVQNGRLLTKHLSVGGSE